MNFLYDSKFVYILVVILYLSLFSNAKNDLPLCKNNGHTKGTWEYIPDKNLKKRFRCCDWETKDENDMEECGNDNYNHGNSYNGSDLYYAHVGARACTCDQRDGTLHKVTERESYKWVPNDCRLLEWDGKEFCKLLGNRRILFVGASTMQQTSSTIMSMIKADNGGCAHQLYFTVDFHFDVKRDGPVAWHMVAQSTKPDIVIITAGGHVRGLDGVHKLFDPPNKLTDQIKGLQNEFGDEMTLVWRTNQAGHSECGPSAKPNTPYNFVGVDEHYHLELHLKYDKECIERVKRLGLKVLDMSPTYLRPDAHPYITKGPGSDPDCFHYCTPGPIDLSAILLYQMLYNKEL